MAVDRRLFDYNHLPDFLKAVSQPFKELVDEMDNRFIYPQRGENRAEVEAGVRKLLEAKDCFVRAAVIEKMDKEDSNND